MRGGGIGRCFVHGLGTGLSMAVFHTLSWGVGRPTPKLRVKKTAIDRPVPKPHTKQRPIPPPHKKKPADQPSKHNKFLREWRMEQVPEYNDLTTFLRDSQSWAHRVLQNELKELKSLKLQLPVQVELIKYNVDDGNILDTATPWLHTKMNVLFQPEIQ